MQRAAPLLWHQTNTRASYVLSAPGTVSSGWPQSTSRKATRAHPLASSALTSRRANVDLPVPCPAAPLFGPRACGAGAARRKARRARAHLAAAHGRRGRGAPGRGERRARNGDAVGRLRRARSRVRSTVRAPRQPRSQLGSSVDHASPGASAEQTAPDRRSALSCHGYASRRWASPEHCAGGQMSVSRSQGAACLGHPDTRGRPHTCRHSGGTGLKAGVAAASDGSQSRKLLRPDGLADGPPPPAPPRAPCRLPSGGWASAQSGAPSLAPVSRSSNTAAPSPDSGTCAPGARPAVAGTCRLSHVCLFLGCGGKLNSTLKLTTESRTEPQPPATALLRGSAAGGAARRCWAQPLSQARR